MLQVSYLSNSDEFRNSRGFPQFIQLYPSEANLAPKIAFTIENFEWKQVAVITQAESIFATVSK